MEIPVPAYYFDRQSADFDYRQETTRLPGKLKDKRKLLCHLCLHLITDQAQGILKDGSHIHVCTNPHGHSYRFACYLEAPGCVQAGPASFEYSWFGAHSWQIALCSNCGEHLGWLFRGESRFYGLIVNRLIEENRKSS